MFRTFAFAIALMVGLPGAALADIRVTNKTLGTIQVQIETGPKTEIRSNETAVLQSNRVQARVTVYSFGFERASTTVQNNSRLVVETRQGVWIIRPE
ncbi:MAG: hypothetical protein NZ700_12565 [Gemmataceae bacterium]|nr:hypothetical protein [Gemmataceae bacterium]MDW8263943.1 hypothetical protein [Gemmataceae bacterium]